MANANREALMRRIQSASFAVVDIGLYLDTHPTDALALDYYQKFRDLHAPAVAEYTQNYGPLTKEAVEVDDCWAWVKAPWPWERQV